MSLIGLFALATLTTESLAGPKGHPPGHSSPALKTIPHGAQKVKHGKEHYYFHGGHFYRPDKGWYRPVRPPVGIFVNTLPIAAITLIVGGLTYYCYDSIYYRRVSGGYLVVDLPDSFDTQVAGSIASGTLADGTPVRVNVNVLNVRSGPGKNHPMIAQVRYGNRLVVKGNAPNWLYVRLSDGRYGWVMKRFVSLSNADAKG